MELGFENLPPIKTVFQLIFYVMVGIFAVFSAVLYYHWTNYSMEKSVTSITLIAYLVCTLPLVIIMGAIILIV